MSDDAEDHEHHNTSKSADEIIDHVVRMSKLPRRILRRLEDVQSL